MSRKPPGAASETLALQGRNGLVRSRAEHAIHIVARAVSNLRTALWSEVSMFRHRTGDDVSVGQ